jgi:hypothetical protein
LQQGKRIWTPDPAACPDPKCPNALALPFSGVSLDNATIYLFY